MRLNARLLLVFSLVTLLLPGCSGLHLFGRKKRPAKVEESGAVVQIGAISLVNTDASFVLIDNGYRMPPAMGETLESRGSDGSIAQLHVTEIRKRPFVIADIVSGTPGKGDLVFQQKKAEKPASTPQPQSQ
jgi:hypothetical protein